MIGYIDLDLTQDYFKNPDQHKQFMAMLKGSVENDKVQCVFAQGKLLGVLVSPTTGMFEIADALQAKILKPETLKGLIDSDL